VGESSEESGGERGGDDFSGAFSGEGVEEENAEESVEGGRGGREQKVVLFCEVLDALEVGEQGLKISLEVEARVKQAIFRQSRDPGG
jgi:hypothetical protein